MEICKEYINSTPLEKFINDYLEMGWKFKQLFQVEGTYYDGNRDVKYYSNYVIFIKP